MYIYLNLTEPELQLQVGGGGGGGGMGGMGEQYIVYGWTARRTMSNEVLHKLS